MFQRMEMFRVSYEVGKLDILNLILGLAPTIKTNQQLFLNVKIYSSKIILLVLNDFSIKNYYLLIHFHDLTLFC